MVLLHLNLYNAHYFIFLEFRDCNQAIYFEKCDNEHVAHPNLVENCLFADNNEAICLGSSAARTIIKNNAFIKSKICAIKVDHGCVVDVLVNTIEYGKRGVISHENTKISLTNNIIRLNEEFGVNIREGGEIGEFFGNKITQNGGVGNE